MRSTKMLLSMVFASSALALVAAEGDEEGITDRNDSKLVTVTEPKADATIAREAKMTVEGTVKVEDGTKAPELVIVRLVAKGSLELGSYGLRLNDETEEYGRYQLKDGIHKFRFNIKAPKWPGKCKVIVMSIRADGSKITREHSKPIAIDVR